MYEIQSLNDQGLGVCFVDNKLTFVYNTLIGDVVDIPGLASFEGINWIYFGKDSNGNDLVTTSKGIAVLMPITKAVFASSLSLLISSKASEFL